MTNSIITLTTDFGTADGYVGTMKGVILSINPQAIIVDITHNVAPQNIEQAAFLLAASAPYFPVNAIHVVVVDPGVGTARRPIAVQVGETIYLAPDNGVLSLAISNLPASQSPGSQHLRLTQDQRSPVGVQASLSLSISAYHLTRTEYFLPRVSNTFHGRDLFAPCAAHLSLGVPLHAMGEPITDWVRLPRIEPSRRVDGAIVGRVAHIDRFGNVITNIAAETLEGMNRERLIIEIAQKKIEGIKRAYADGVAGEILALIGSHSCVEIAQRDGNAAKALGVRVGATVIAKERSD